MKFFKYSLFICLLMVGLFLSFDVVFTLEAGGKSVEPVGPVIPKKKTSGGGTTQTTPSVELDPNLDYSMSLGPNAVSQLCWTEIDCEKAGGNLYGPKEDTIKTCGVGVDQEENKIGFCRPGVKAKTTMGFAGRKEFDDFGELINFMYRYGVIIAGVLAVIMIIIAGFQRVVSAGSPDKIKASTKRIGDALMGLFLAVMAYFILNTLNPYLVNMRLPQVWMINRQELIPVDCGNLPSEALLAVAYTEANLTAEDITQRYNAAVKTGFKKTPSEAKCGTHYFVKGGGALTCVGINCAEEGKACTGDANTSQYKCLKAALAGKIEADDTIVCNDLTENIIDKELQLIAMFKNGELEVIDKIILVDGARNYLFSVNVNREIIAAEKDKKDLVGFYLGAEINDERGPACAIVAGGCDDWHAIGKSNDNVCDVNLGKLGSEKLFKNTTLNCAGSTGVDRCSCASISNPFNVKILAIDSDFTKHLFTAKELIAGYTCNININRAEFPDLDNKSGWVLCDYDRTKCNQYQ